MRTEGAVYKEVQNFSQQSVHGSMRGLCTAVKAPSFPPYNNRQVSLEERTKFKEETYSNVDGRRRTSSIDLKPSGKPT